MSPRTRFLIRWAFILTFFIVTPAVILTTAGYRYNFSKTRLEKTGVLVFDSEPKGAAVFVNDRRLKNHTPTRDTRLLAGTYQVRMEKPGYRAWMKTVEVASGETTFVNDVTLFRESLPDLVTETPVSQASFSPDGRYGAVLSVKDGGAELRLHDIKSGETRVPYRTQSAAGADFGFSWADDSQRLMIRRTIGGRHTFLIWDSARPEKVTDLRDTAPESYLSAFWSEGGQKLSAAGNRTLYEINLANWRATPKGPIAPDAAARTLPGDARLTAVVNANGEVLVTDPKDPESSWKLSGLDGAWSRDGKRLLYWSAPELRVFSAEDKTDILVTRLSTTIQKALWYAEGGLALFASGNSVYITETWHDGDRAVTSLVSFDTFSDMILSADGDAVYFAGTIGEQSGIWSLRLR